MSTLSQNDVLIQFIPSIYSRPIAVCMFYKCLRDKNVNDRLHILCLVWKRNRLISNCLKQWIGQGENCMPHCKHCVCLLVQTNRTIGTLNWPKNLPLCKGNWFRPCVYLWGPGFGLKSLLPPFIWICYLSLDINIAFFTLKSIVGCANTLDDKT